MSEIWFHPAVGQTSRKLFTSPHPERYLHGLHSLPLGTLHGIEEDPHLLAQGPQRFKGKSATLSLRCVSSCFFSLLDLGPTVPVRDLVLNTMGDNLKMVPCPEGMSQYPHESVEWRIGSAELLITRLSRWSSMLFAGVPSLQMPVLVVLSMAPVIIRFGYGKLSVVWILIILRAPCRCLYPILCVYTRMKWHVLPLHGHDASVSFLQVLICQILWTKKNRW